MASAREYAAKKLKEARRRAGLSTYQVAEKVGSSQSVIYRLEEKSARIDAVLLMRLCRLYGIPADQVLGTYDDDVETAPAELATVEV